MDYNLFDTVKRIWALGKCAIEIIYLLFTKASESTQTKRIHVSRLNIILLKIVSFGKET